MASQRLLLLRSNLPCVKSVLANSLARALAILWRNLSEFVYPCLCSVSDLENIAKELNFRLTGAVRKHDIVEQLLFMAMIDAIRKDMSGESIRITYITDAVRSSLEKLPRFSDVTEWSKTFRDYIKQFHFMDLWL